MVFGLFWGAWAVAVADVERSLHLSHPAFGLLLSAAALGAGLMNAVAGSLTERWGTQRALAASLLVWGALMVSGSVTERPAALAVLVVGVIAAGGAVDVAMNIAAAAGLADQPGRLVRFHALFNVGAATGALATGLLLRSGLSWRTAWAGGAALAMMAAVALRGADLPAGASGERHSLLHALRTVRTERLVLLAAVFAGGAMVEGGIDTWGVLFMRERLASGVLVGATAYVLGQLVATSARGGLGPLTGSLGARRGVVIGGGVAAAGLVLLALAPVAPLAGLGLLVAAAGVSVCWPLLVARASTGVARPAAVVAGVTALGYLGFVVGPPLVGWLAGLLGLRAGVLALAVVAGLVAVARPSAPDVRVDPG